MWLVLIYVRVIYVCVCLFMLGGCFLCVVLFSGYCIGVIRLGCLIVVLGCCLRGVSYLLLKYDC